MKEIYGVFAFTLVTVAALGGLLGLVPIAPRWRIGERVLERVELVATIIASLTAAGILGLAFMVDTLTSTDNSLSTFLQIPHARESLGMVVWQIAAGGVGLLMALGLAIWDRNPPRTTSVGWLRRWVGRCLAISAAIVVLLFPAIIVLIISTHDALFTPMP